MNTQKTTFSPDFIGVGGEKTASTWIYKCLLEHPQICGPQKKELAFFDTTKVIGWPAREKSEYEREGIEKYATYFSHCESGKIRGEFTVTYLHDKKVAKILSELFPKTKILISLRNPIDRTYSQYQGLREKDRAVYGSFEEALKQEPEFIRRSQYSEYIAEYYKYFPREQILIVLFDEIQTDPEKALEKIYTFLGVNATFRTASANQKERSAEQKKLQQFRDTVHSSTVGRFLLTLGKSLNVNRFLKNVFLKFAKKDRMRPETRAKLCDTIAHDITELEKMLNTDLSNWK